jgi:hypothetical protein
MRRKSAISVAVVLGALLAALFSPLAAQNLIEQLISPGDVVKAHAKTEKDCSSCHESFSKLGQDKLCVACHKDIGADLRDKSGFHGKSESVRTTVCKHCHTDHKGRDFDILQFDRETFDHAATNFTLDGAHKMVRCESCHKPGKKFREALKACIGCHKSADPHNGRLGESCGNCHNERIWKEAKSFDHGKTDFALTGAHVDTACTACHAGERYKGVPKACIGCHRQEDKHKGLYGEKCESCHGAKVWSAITFDHDRDTKYPLVAKHISVPCEMCHKEDPKSVKTPTVCSGCHLKDDVHKTRLGKECQDCHNISGWPIGALFDHSKTKLPLTGKHAETKCADCHKAKIYDPIAATCVSCHAKKDVHLGRLGPKCEQCHNDTVWKTWRFDHAKQTKFALTGAHANAGCYGCHEKKGVERATLPVACNSCHKKDDTHKGAFGTNCAKCHTTEHFLPAFVPR